MLGNNTESKTYWLKPVNGKFEWGVKDKREGFIAKVVETSDGKKVTKYVKEFDYIEGSLSDVYSEDSDYGKRWVVKITDNDEVYIITFKYSSGYSKSFLNQIERIDLSKLVKVSCTYKEEEKNGKTVKNTAIWLSQKTQSGAYGWVGFKYSKDNPQGRPDLKEVVVRGEKIYDDTDQLAYYDNVVNTIFNEKKLKAATNFTESSDLEIFEIPSEVPEAKASKKVATPDLDDLPF
jgi:hypothetical protein